MISTATRSSGFPAPSPTSFSTRSGPPPSPEGAWRMAQPGRLRLRLLRLPAKLARHSRERYVPLLRDDPAGPHILLALRRLASGLPPPLQPDYSRPVLLQAPLPGRPPRPSNTHRPAQHHSPGPPRFPPSAPVFHPKWSCRLSVDGARGVRRSMPKRLAGEAVSSGAIHLPPGRCCLRVVLHDGGSETCRGVVWTRGY